MRYVYDPADFGHNEFYARNIHLQSLQRVELHETALLPRPEGHLPAGWTPQKLFSQLGNMTSFQPEQKQDRKHDTRHDDSVVLRGRPQPGEIEDRQLAVVRPSRHVGVSVE
jgi:hypothetical protein